MRSMKRNPKPGLPRLFDRPKYRQRNIIARMYGWLKENRRIVTRFEEPAKSYAAMVCWCVPCGIYDTFFRTEPRADGHAGLFAGNPALTSDAHGEQSNMNVCFRKLTFLSVVEKPHVLSICQAQ
ncbi:hypothetical protein GCM10011247_32550 [Pseudomonas plecoglossicida]|nr:hypothetical protein GCM10011247_32550 [Pseudomonas plecoglossicida]